MGGGTLTLLCVARGIVGLRCAQIWALWRGSLDTLALRCETWQRWPWLLRLRSWPRLLLATGQTALQADIPLLAVSTYVYTASSGLGENLPFCQRFNPGFRLVETLEIVYLPLHYR